jgi:hypothetical protein
MKSNHADMIDPATTDNLPGAGEVEKRRGQIRVCVARKKMYWVWDLGNAKLDKG